MCCRDGNRFEHDNQHPPWQARIYLCEVREKKKNKKTSPSSKTVNDLDARYKQNQPIRFPSPQSPRTPHRPPSPFSFILLHTAASSSQEPLKDTQPQTPSPLPPQNTSVYLLERGGELKLFTSSQIYTTHRQGVAKRECCKFKQQKKKKRIIFGRQRWIAQDYR